MARVTFTDNLQRHIACPPSEQPGATVGEVLAGVFEENPMLRSYVLDDQGRLRKHVAVFLNDALVADRVRLSDGVRDTDEIFVFQALSGG
ncbi:MAG: MoaD/ThiS family protein [Pseudomonadota bacterium]